MPFVLGCGATQEELLIMNLRDLGAVFALAFPATIAVGLMFAVLLHAGRSLAR